MTDAEVTKYCRARLGVELLYGGTSSEQAKKNAHPAGRRARY